MYRYAPSGKIHIKIDTFGRDPWRLERDRRRGEQWEPVEAPPVDFRPPMRRGPLDDVSHLLLRDRRGHAQRDPHLKFFTSLCEDLSDTQRLQTDVAADAALRLRQKPSRWGQDAREKEGEDEGGHAKGSRGMPAWLTHLSRNASAAALMRTMQLHPKQVETQKQFPVSSGEQHKTLYVTSAVP